MPQVINPVVDPDDVNNKAPRLHAAQHKAGGDDPITPEDIGASPENHTHPATTWNNLEGKPSTFPPETHNHDERYSGIHHNHDDAYAVVNHQHGEKADLVNGKLKADQLPLINWGEIEGVPVTSWNDLQDKPSTFPPSSHNHDGTYAAASHTHQGLGGVPVGAIMPYAGASAPADWLICNGRAVASSTYPALYSAIGTKYGGNSTNFNLPNLQGRVPIGVSSGHALGTTGGAETVTLTTNQIPAHSHGITVHTQNGDVSPSMVAGARSSSGSGSSSTNNSGGGQAHNNMQPFITLNYIIKVK